MSSKGHIVKKNQPNQEVTNLNFFLEYDRAVNFPQKVKINSIVVL